MSSSYFGFNSRSCCLELHLFSIVINNCYTRAFFTFLLVLKPWKEISKVGKLWKSAVSDRNNDYFFTNWPKEMSLTSFKRVSDVHKQYTLLCEIFRMRTISENTVSQCMSFFQLCRFRLNCSGFYWHQQFENFCTT